MQIFSIIEFFIFIKYVQVNIFNECESKILLHPKYKEKSIGIETQNYRLIE